MIALDVVSIIEIHGCFIIIKSFAELTQQSICYKNIKDNDDSFDKMRQHRIHGKEEE